MAKKYFKVVLGTSKEIFYVTASNMDSIWLWVLKNYSMDEYYSAYIAETWADKDIKKDGDFYCMAIRDYYHSNEAYGDMSDEEIRMERVKFHRNRVKEVLR